MIFGTGSEIYQSDLRAILRHIDLRYFQKLDKTPKELFEDKTNQGVVAQNLREQTITEAEQSWITMETISLQTSKALYLAQTKKLKKAH